MRKDHIRDYATEAFRYYARLGKTFEQVKEEIYKEAIEKSKNNDIKTNNICSPTELAMMRADKAVIEKKGELEDILAVEETLKQLAYEYNGSDIKKVVQLVYFENPSEEIERNEFTRRVIYAANQIHCDERTVYRYLGKARSIFAENRGLRKTNKHIS
ncbi:hypothetical protein CS063_01465 [Sporanaerobium hydrogeniformans]|uniref:Uncharacterized protein n=1 Tax=Sporanaerobium hydrogeniformans TaxID=3072179 RepID=A0AC61DHW6_9FIRM|nr:hypothetical protein [Sporanaerobium hydrogeniformans]PHV72171.1 hypothetical protein CS063_01465 [Sporanaerobium hydrogeniformans]